MPFTLTHIVAVVPFWPVRRILSFEALAIGAMTPDLPLFIPVISYTQTHSPLGALTICLPVGVVLFLLFDAVMRRPLIGLLPNWVGCRLPASSIMPSEPRLDVQLRYFAGTALAIVIGAYTHQVWDAFTHQGRWGTLLIPELNQEFEIGDRRVPGYKLLQYGSTFAGLPLLAFLAIWKLNQTLPVDRPNSSLPTRWKLVAVALLIAIPAIVGVFAMVTYSTASQALGITIKRSVTIILVGLLAYSLADQFVTGTEEDSTR